MTVAFDNDFFDFYFFHFSLGIQYIIYYIILFHHSNLHLILARTTYITSRHSRPNNNTKVIVISIQ